LSTGWFWICAWLAKGARLPGWGHFTSAFLGIAWKVVEKCSMAISVVYVAV